MKFNPESLKLVSMNLAAWFSTIFSISMVKDVLQIACFFASLAVSAASFWWIRKQAKALEDREGRKRPR